MHRKARIWNLERSYKLVNVRIKIQIQSCRLQRSSLNQPFPKLAVYRHSWRSFIQVHLLYNNVMKKKEAALYTSIWCYVFLESLQREGK